MVTAPPFIFSGPGAWYDTKHYIKEHLSDPGPIGLDGLNAVARDRALAGYSRGERLSEYIIMGQWWMDTCGNTGDITMGWSKEQTTPKAKFPNILPVLTRDEFWAFLAQNGVDNPQVSISMGHNIPVLGILCPICKGHWRLDNAHDCERHTSHELIPLEDQIGKRLIEVVAGIDRARDLQCRLAPERFLRNDRYIDLTPVPGYDTLVVNAHGWVDHDMIDPATYEIQSGDEMAVIITKYYHPACHKEMVAKGAHTDFRSIFRRAGFSNKLLSLRTVPNEYGSESYNGPWFVVGTPLGSIRIGWRKRVIEIDWSEIGVDLKHLFHDQDVTKEPTLIHAWKEEDAVEYLQRIREALLERQRRRIKPKRRR